jgi:hypothetical protein
MKFMWNLFNAVCAYILIVTAFIRPELSAWYKGFLIVGAIGWMKSSDRF